MLFLTSLIHSTDAPPNLDPTQAAESSVEAIKSGIDSGAYLSIAPLEK